MRRHGYLVLICAALVACSDEAATSSGAPDAAIDALSPTGDAGGTPRYGIDGLLPELDAAGGVDTILASSCLGEKPGTPCDDGNACTVDDACDQGVCVGGSTLTCDDQGTCRLGSCDPEVGCVLDDQPDDTPCTLPCFGAASCQAGVCEADPVTQVKCPPPTDPCVSELACDPGTGECTKNIYKEEGTSCNADGNICTLEVCTSAGECLSTGLQETCSVQSAASPCWTWTCNQAKGCIQTAFVNGASCDDLNPCTVNDLCTEPQPGLKACLGSPLNLDDGNPCTDDKCDETGVKHLPIDGVPCEPDDPCGIAGACEAGACKTTEAKACTDDNPCTDDLCDPESGGCTFVNNTSKQPCYTGDAGTLGHGLCAQGVRTCSNGAFGACLGETLPSDELCDGLDNDCDGLADEGFPDPDADGIASCVDTDDDGDGYPDTLDCGPTDPAVHPGATEACNGEDDDCDTLVDEDLPDQDGDGTPDCLDPDKDGDGDPNTTDCGPADPTKYHGAPEICDGQDQDCDGVIDDAGPGTTGTAEAPDDGNPCTVDVCLGGGPKHQPQSGVACPPPDACALNGVCAAGVCVAEDLKDCADANPCTDDSCNGATGSCVHTPNTATEPCYTGPSGTLDVGTCASGARTCSNGSFGPCKDQTLPGGEVCDGDDNDCDGVADEGFPDTDGDGIASCVDDDDDGDGSPDTLDCGPLQPSVYPGAPEQCNGVDDDCDGTADEGFADQDLDGVADCVDQDLDGDGDANLTDCAPTDPTIHHGATEECDGIDQNCNGLIDDGAPDLDGDGLPNCVDDDDDGDGILDVVDNCSQVPNVDQANWDMDAQGDVCDLDDDNDGTPDETDCAPLDKAIHPGAVELCNEIDDDCDGAIDEGLPDLDGDWIPDCRDGDIDGDGDPNATDCLPMDATVYHGAVEVCDGKDQDCDGVSDDAGPGTTGTAPVADDGDPCTTDLCQAGKPTYLPTSGLPCVPSTPCGTAGVCSVGVCSVTETKDCSDGNPCTDDACNTLTGGCVHTPNANTEPCYTGAEGTLGKGPCAAGLRTCSGGGFGTCKGQVLPAGETCDGIDNDCDGATDEGFPNFDGDEYASCVDPDDDNDGWLDGEDCAPLQPSIYPGAPEECNGIDESCDGVADDGFPDADNDGVADCVDQDIDGDGEANATDCEPLDPTIHHGAPELCDGIDQNCNGIIDDGAPDLDGDGIPNCIDDDLDGDGIPNVEDNCPDIPNQDQTDTDHDGYGDACDLVTLGPLATLLVRSEPGGGGQEVGAVAITLADTLHLYAAGYDGEGHYLGDQSVGWTVTGSLDPVPAGPASSVAFTPKTAQTSGTILILPPANTVTDATGTITVGWPPVGPPSTAQSVIYTDKGELVSNGTATTTVYVELLDQWGQAVEAEHQVVIQTTLGTLKGSVSFLGGGAYSQTLTASTSPGTAVVSATIDGAAMLQTAQVKMVEEIDLVAKGISKVDCTNYALVKAKKVVVRAGTVTMNTSGCGPLQLQSLEVLQGGKLTTDGCATGVAPDKLDLIVSGLLVDATSSIDVSGRGYRPTDAPPGSGAPTGDASGGSHGGKGTGSAVQTTYDSIDHPSFPGSAGSTGTASTGGCGGGVVQIVVTTGGVATVNGKITANGVPGTQQAASGAPKHGAGAGGTVVISASKLLGAGSITANGGSVIDTSCVFYPCSQGVHRAGGGGGRIALMAYTARSPAFQLPGLFASVRALGGLTSESGGVMNTKAYAAAGTIWLQGASDTYGTLIVDNGGQVPTTADTVLNMPGQGTVLEVTKLKIAEYGAFTPDLHTGWWVNPNVAQGDPATLVDDSVAYVTGNDKDNLFFSPSSGVQLHTQVGATWRGLLRIARLEVRGKARVTAPGDLLVLDGDLHSPVTAPLTFDVADGSLIANILEVPEAGISTITGAISAAHVWCGTGCN